MDFDYDRALALPQLSDKSLLSPQLRLWTQQKFWEPTITEYTAWTKEIDASARLLEEKIAREGGGIAPPEAPPRLAPFSVEEALALMSPQGSDLPRNASKKGAKSPLKKSGASPKGASPSAVAAHKAADKVEPKVSVKVEGEQQAKSPPVGRGGRMIVSPLEKWGEVLGCGYVMGRVGGKKRDREEDEEMEREREVQREREKERKREREEKAKEEKEKEEKEREEKEKEEKRKREERERARERRRQEEEELVRKRKVEREMEERERREKEEKEREEKEREEKEREEKEREEKEREEKEREEKEREEKERARLAIEADSMLKISLDVDNSEVDGQQQQELQKREQAQDEQQQQQQGGGEQPVSASGGAGGDITVTSASLNVRAKRTRTLKATLQDLIPAAIPVGATVTCTLPGTGVVCNGQIAPGKYITFADNPNVKFPNPTGFMKHAYHESGQSVNASASGWERVKYNGMSLDQVRGLWEAQQLQQKQQPKQEEGEKQQHSLAPAQAPPQSLLAPVFPPPPAPAEAITKGLQAFANVFGLGDANMSQDMVQARAGQVALSLTQILQAASFGSLMQHPPPSSSSSSGPAQSVASSSSSLPPAAGLPPSSLGVGDSSGQPQPPPGGESSEPVGDGAVAGGEMGSKPVDDVAHLAEQKGEGEGEGQGAAVKSEMVGEGGGGAGRGTGEDTGVLFGKCFVITGVLETMERMEAVKLIEKNGGEVAQMGEVMSLTSYVIAGYKHVRPKVIKQPV